MWFKERKSKGELTAKEFTLVFWHLLNKDYPHTFEKYLYDYEHGVDGKKDKIAMKEIIKYYGINEKLVIKQQIRKRVKL